MTTTTNRPGRPAQGQGDVGQVLLREALRLFRSVGYHGASVRDIAQAAGVTPAAVYHHFSSKQAILRAIMVQAMEDNVAAVTSAAAEHEGDPVQQVAAMVATIVRYHANHPDEAFVGDTELRSLEGESRTGVIALRDREEQLLTDVIAAGAEAGAFRCPYPKQAARSLIAMASSVAGWFRPDGPLTAEEVTDQYVTLALNLVGVDPQENA